MTWAVRSRCRSCRCSICRLNRRSPEDESELGGDYAGGELESYEQEEADGVQQEDRRSSKEKRQQEKERKKYKFLSAHCENLTQKAKDGKIDHIVGRVKRSRESSKSSIDEPKTTLA